MKDPDDDTEMITLIENEGGYEGADLEPANALLHGVAEFWNSKAFTDLEVVCGVDGKVVQSHRLVLSALSPVIRHALASVTAESYGSSAVLIIPDITSRSLTEFLDNICCLDTSLQVADMNQDLTFLGFGKQTLPLSSKMIEEDIQQLCRLKVTSRKRSFVWDYFVPTSNKKKAVCSLCKISLTTDGGSTSGLARHLKNNHSITGLNHKVNKAFQEGIAEVNDENILETTIEAGAKVLEDSKKKLRDLKARKSAILSTVDDLVASSSETNFSNPSSQTVIVNEVGECVENAAVKNEASEDISEAVVFQETALEAQANSEVVTEVSEDFKISLTGEKSPKELDESGIVKQSFSADCKTGNQTEQHQKKTCSECQKSFSSTSAMNYHKKTVHSADKPFECEICSQTFARKDSFLLHVNSHDKSKRDFLCTLCGKSFRRQYHRDQHERLHDDPSGPPRNYKCTDCDKKFRTNQQLKNHEMTHTGEKPHPCNHCNKRFARVHQLKTHMLRHTGDKPHTCDLCGQTFRHSSTKNVHKCRNAYASTSAAPAGIGGPTQKPVVVGVDENNVTTLTWVQCD